MKKVLIVSAFAFIALFAALSFVGCETGPNDNKDVAAVTTAMEGSYVFDSSTVNRWINLNTAGVLSADKCKIIYTGITFTGNSGRITGEIFSQSLGNIANITYDFTFVLNEGSVRTWAYDTINSLYIAGSTYTGKDFDITWGNLTVTPTSNVATMNTQGVYSKTDWAVGTSATVNTNPTVCAAYYLAQVGNKSITTVTTLSSTELNPENDGLTPNYTRWAFGFGMLYNFMGSLYSPAVADENTTRMIGSLTRIKK